MENETCPKLDHEMELDVSDTASIDADPMPCDPSAQEKEPTPPPVSSPLSPAKAVETKAMQIASPALGGADDSSLSDDEESDKTKKKEPVLNEPGRVQAKIAARLTRRNIASRARYASQKEKLEQLESTEAKMQRFSDRHRADKLKIQVLQGKLDTVTDKLEIHELKASLHQATTVKADTEPVVKTDQEPSLE
jgi:hypothetical protein